MLREVIPAYFQSPYVGRYDDIWPSYIATRIINHFGDVVAYGQPVLRQKRNEHNLWKDLDNERVGMLLTDEFCATLRSIPLTGTTYHECCGELAMKLPQAWQPSAKWSDASRALVPQAARHRGARSCTSARTGGENSLAGIGYAPK
jgi:hypothetical protein